MKVKNFLATLLNNSEKETKKMKRFLATLLTGVMLMSNGVVAFAADVPVSGGTATGSTPTSFTVDNTVLGGDLVVSVPADMTLTYDSSSSTFKSADVVSAKGRILASKKLEVKTPTAITYKNDDDNSITVPGTITFGSVSGSDQLTEWSAAQLLTSLTTLDSRNITASVNKNDISYIGTYKATINYNIDVVNK